MGAMELASIVTELAAGLATADALRPDAKSQRGTRAGKRSSFTASTTQTSRWTQSSTHSSCSPRGKLN
jgi:hypothetical protein